MSHPAAFARNEVPFCQRNNRLWVVVLVASAVGVLGLAIWLAMRDGKLHRSGHFGGGGTIAQPAAAPAQGPPAAGRQVALVGPAGAASGIAGWSLPVAAPGGPTGGVADRLQSSFNAAADLIRPAVVNINAIRPSTGWNRAAQPGGAQFVDPFDGVPDKVIGQMAFESVGSGVIIDPAGYVVTNDHLVHDATSIAVTLFRHQEALPAVLIAAEPDRDLALLQIQSDQQFPAAQLANSNQVEVGDWVLAVGNPFGLGHTVTSGIVSGRRTSIVISGVRYKDLIQTDAPINQGSSGGPLVDLRGKVVGIDTAIYAPTGVFNGTGFAIPSNQVGSFVARSMPAHRAHTAARPVALVGAAAPAAGGGRSWLGLQGSAVTPGLAAKLGLARAEGVFVNGVTPGSPAAEAEIRRGDVVIEIAGRAVGNPTGLDSVTRALPPGLVVPVVVWRDGVTSTRKLKLGFQR